MVLFAVSGCGRGTHILAPATPTPAPYATGDYPEYGFAPDLSWVAGRVFVALRGQTCTYVIFSTARGAVWGGMFALQSAPGVLDGLHGGNAVVLHGALSPTSVHACGSRVFNVRLAELH